MRLLTATVCLLGLVIPAFAKDGNRLAYLDEAEPYYPSRTFPKLITPQWVGEQGVEAVVILAIDDMREPAKYEAFLRPALDRLKKIDGRAPVSIMTCKVKPDDEQLQKWLKEGLSIECHTTDHPCPILQGGDLAKSKGTYDTCVDLLSKIPGNKPVAFRTPCCDSKNTPSPRLWAEIFNKTTPEGKFLSIDSSVFNVTTPNDPELPRSIVYDAEGRDRFKRYLPFKNFVNTIEDYPYPYIIDRLCWQFPCAVPSDWQSFNIQGKVSPRLLEDWKAGLDATVIKQGVFTLVFHPHGWSSPQQIADLVDYADKTYGKKVKFLTFKEAQERLDENLLLGQPIRNKNGGDNGVRLIDLNNDGYLDVVISNRSVSKTRVWSPSNQSWGSGKSIGAISDAGDGELDKNACPAIRFGVLGEGHTVIAMSLDDLDRRGWRFTGEWWEPDEGLVKALPKSVEVRSGPFDHGLRLRDIDGDGDCELVSSYAESNVVYRWDKAKSEWSLCPFQLPADIRIVNRGADAGTRFVDIDGDGCLDLISANKDRFAVRLFDSMTTGWSREVPLRNDAKRGFQRIVTGDRGSNNGGFFHNRSLCVINENTAGLADHLDRVTFNELLANVEPDRPRSPEAALKGIKAKPGFVVEQMAAEPLVNDPIAFSWGADGKLWVVEMGDYPLGVDGKGTVGGVVRYLEDTDGDRVYDKSTVFLDHLGYPTGVMPWGKGVIVTCAPDIFYAEDPDGDGKADKREVLFTGFKEGNQQHRVNGLVWGLDNWIYCANGDSGGAIKSLKTGKTIDISGRDFRFRMDGSMEAVTGQSQFGRTQDDWGNWFGCNNSNPVYQFVLEDRYLKRNPHLTPPAAKVNVSSPPGAAPVFPISRTMPRFNDFHTANHFTSACSVMIYRDDLFGPQYAGNAFVSEPVHDLVSRFVMSHDGLIFTAKRAEDEQASEFLASTDNWFRPTTIKTGPDGALWVADMYRMVIEHPQWIPKETQAKLDLRSGHDKGRIYRVLPVGVKPRAIPKLGDLDVAGLVAALECPSGWQRDTAQQLLVQKQDKAAIPLLEQLAVESKRPQTRLQALCTLDGLGALSADVATKAMKDEHAGVRRNAIRVTEPLLAKDARLGVAVAKLADDADPFVRMQVAYTLGEWDDGRSGDALAKLALKATDDPYLSAAVLSSVNPTNLSPILKAVAGARGADGRPPTALLGNLLRMAGAMGDQKAVFSLLGQVAKKDGDTYQLWQFTAMDVLLDRIEEGGTNLAEMSKAGGGGAATQLRPVLDLIGEARAIASDDGRSEDERAAAIRLMGRGVAGRDQDLRVAATFLSPQQPTQVQLAAVATIAKSRDAKTPDRLLAGWKNHSPAVRAGVIDTLMARSQWWPAVLDAIEKKTIAAADLDAARRQKLLKSSNADVKERAAKLLAGSVNPDRQKVIDKFSASLTATGDAKHGGELFAKTCAPCHKLADAGFAVGPDLASVGDKSPEGLLISILDPNRAVESRYTAYLAETRTGDSFSGILSAEAGGSVTVLQAGGAEKQILRADLATLRSTGLSLMPEGLEAGLQPQDLADLITYIRGIGGTGTRREFSGNRPEIVAPDGKGTLKLTPGSAEIYGKTIVLEKQYGNLGFWTSEEDHATWTAQPSRAGVYDVWLTYACASDSAGNVYVVQSGGQQLTGTVDATKNWDTYQRSKVGQITLEAGRARITVRPAGKLRNALMDLKEIELTPVATK